MNVEFWDSFARDLKQINDKALLKRVGQVIKEVERAKTLIEISNLRKLKGRGDYYRIRIGDGSASRSQVGPSYLFAS